MRAVAALVLCAACGFHPSPAVGDGRNPDGESPNPEGLPPPEKLAPGCYGTGFVTVCPTVTPSTPLHIGTAHIDTNSPADCVALDPPQPVCVIAGSDVKIQNFLSAEGDRPLVVLSLSTLDVTGTIDVASHRSGSPQTFGPGAITATCPDVGALADTGAGAGGSFGGKGGDGGDDGSNLHGGAAANAIVPTTLRGGCPGGKGLTYSSMYNAGGAAGGAIQLIAVQAITVGAAAEIDASGEGGGGAPATFNGGGGGGAGGMIVFDAPSLTIDQNAMVYANGGGGGGGTTGNPVAVGNNGGDPSGFNSGGTGGTGVPGMFPTDPGGGTGGDGARFDNTGGVGGRNGRNGGGGGGGGGGYGVVEVLQVTAPTGRISPPAT